MPYPFFLVRPTLDTIHDVKEHVLRQTGDNRRGGRAPSPAGRGMQAAVAV